MVCHVGINLEKHKARGGRFKQKAIHLSRFFRLVSKENGCIIIHSMNLTCELRLLSYKLRLNAIVFGQEEVIQIRKEQY